MNRQTLQALRDAQVAHARAWLEGDAARVAFGETAQAAVDAFLDAPLAEIFDVQAIEAVVDAALSEAVVTATVRPLAIAVVKEVSARARQIEETGDAMVGGEARAKIERLAARNDLVDAEVLRRIVREPGLEAVMRDVLFDALTAFNERTNPFVASWGVPALLDAIPVIGRSAVRRTFESVRAEFDRRLEPEMRKFLAGFAKKSLQDSVDLMMKKADEPEMVAWRQHVAAVILEQRVSEALWSLDDERGQALLAAVEASLTHLLQHPTTRALVVEALGARLGHEGTLRDLASAYGVAVPDLAPAIAAAWPAARRALGTDAALAALARFLDDSHEAFLAARGED